MGIRNEKIYEVVGLGACGIDLRARTPKLPSANHKVVAEKLEVSEGGVTSNNLTQTAKLGLSTKWVGALGEDNWVAYLLKKFQIEGISAQPKIIKKYNTQQFWIITEPKGEWNMVGIPGATKQLKAVNVKKEFAESISQAKHFHTEVAVTPLSAVLMGAKIANKSGGKILVDVDDDPWYLIEKEKIGTKEDFIKLLQIADVIKLSRTGALGITKNKIFNENVIKEILKMGPEIVVVTLAEEGCCLATENEIVYAKGFKVEALDTVGAGDAFMGGLSYGILQNWKLEKIGIFANACGAFKCTQFGTRASGNLKQINKFIKNHEKL